MIILMSVLCVFFLFKQKTADEMRMSDLSSDVCSSDLECRCGPCRATNSGSHGVRRPTSSCAPIRITSGPLIAPPTPGIGMKAGRVESNNNMRSEERRVGKECVSTCRAGWLTDHSYKKPHVFYLTTSTTHTMNST